MEAVTENPNLGDTETWELYNFTEDAHPIHVHEVLFEVVNREGIMHQQPAPGGLPAHPATATPPRQLHRETGYKDTVTAYPGQVARIRTKFTTPGQFVWHCHIVEHEDNEMMQALPHRANSPASRCRRPTRCPDIARHLT